LEATSVKSIQFFGAIQLIELIESIQLIQLIESIQLIQLIEAMNTVCSKNWFEGDAKIVFKDVN